MNKKLETFQLNELLEFLGFATRVNDGELITRFQAIQPYNLTLKMSDEAFLAFHLGRKVKFIERLINDTTPFLW